MEYGLAVIGPSCTECGVCIDSCSFDAIKKIKVGKNAVNISDYHGVWVFAEQCDGKLMNVVAELLGEGRRLADAIGTELCAVLCGNCVEGLAVKLIAYGADKVYLAQAPELSKYTTDAYSKVIHEAITAYKPEIMLLGATHIGRDLAPSLAVKCNTGLTADCTKLEIDPDNKQLMQTRPAFGGNLMATIICPAHRPQMSTVRPGVMEKALYDETRRGEVIPLPVSFCDSDLHVKVIEVVKTIGEIVSLTDADVIVAGGMGLGKPEGFELLKRLANRLGGTIASSRACVDAGWIDHSYQVGQTGTTVKPKLYFGCGISGAIQHLAGIQGAGCIVAINKNESAPIFEVADFGIVGDLYKVIPKFLEILGE